MECDLQSAEARFALALVHRASELARRIRAGTSVRTLIKKDRSPVTLADMGIQALAGALLEEYLPHGVLVAEEDTDHLRTPEGAEDLEKVTGLVRSFFPHAGPDEICRWIERGNGEPTSSFWTLDPIDGTKGFLRGGQYVTALAFIKEGKVELAAIGCPELELQTHKDLGKGVALFAVRGKGCRAFSLKEGPNPKHWVDLRVSPCREIEKARVLESFDPEHKNAEKERRIREALGIRPESVVLDSMAKQAVIAAGDAEIFFRTLPRKDPSHREKIWDVAAGALAIEEAGGRVTDLEGAELDFSTGITLEKNPGFVATNGLLHGAVLEALRQAVQP